jgi:outer membrane receptor protein involved in Fe transport
VAATLTRLLGNHTVKFGGEWRHNRDYLLQTQDAGGPRGVFNFGASGDAGSAIRQPRWPGELVCAFLLDWPNNLQRDLITVHRARHARTGRTSLFVHDKWQLRPSVTVDLGLRLGVLQALRRPRRARRPVELRLRHQHAAGGRLRRHVPANLGVKNDFKHFNPRTGVSWRLDERTCPGAATARAPFRSPTTVRVRLSR